MRLVCNMVTRGRPQMMVDTARETLANMRHRETVLMISMDDDDRETIEMINPLLRLLPPGQGTRVSVSIQAREDTVGAKHNRALRFSADLYMPMVDHTAPGEGFDVKMLLAASRFPDGICMVHTHMANAAFAASMAVSAKWVEVTGRIFEEIFPYWFIDHWTNDVALMVNRVAYADVDCATPYKPPTQGRREATWWSYYFDALYRKRREQAERLLNHMKLNYRGEYANCVDSFPTWEIKSRWSSDCLREIDKWGPVFDEQAPPDARYQRVKQRALDSLPDVLNGLPAGEATFYRNLLMPPMVPRYSMGE